MEQYDKKIILEKIKNNEILTSIEWKILTSDDLLSLDDVNTPYFEYLCKNKVTFCYDMNKECLESLVSNKEALLISLKTEYIKWIRSITNEDIFFEPIIDGKCFVEYVLENGLDWYGKTTFKERIEIVDYFVKYEPSSLCILTPEMNAKLFQKIDGKYFYDKFKNDDSIHIKIICHATFDSIYPYCVDTNNYELLKYCDENVLLTKVDGDKTLLEFILDRNIEPVFFIKKKESLDIFVKKNKINLFGKASLYCLINKYDDNNTYLDLMLNEQKKGNEMHLENFSFGSLKGIHSVDEIVKILLIYLKNNMVGYIIDRLNDKLDVLMFKDKEDGKSVLEVLLEFDKDLIISKLLTKLKLKEQPKFIIYLRSLGIDEGILKIEPDKKYFKDEYIKECSDIYDDGYESEYEDLLIELKNLFYNDGESDKELVDALISSYRYLTSVHSEFGIIELQNLLEIKRNNPKEFIYKYTNKGACFSGEKVYLTDLTISTINHETSHALHYFLSDEFVPEEYDEVVEKVRNNPQFIERVKEFSNNFNAIISNIKDKVVESNVEEYVESKYVGDKVEELQKFLTATIDEQKEKLKDSYSEEVLDILLDKTYSIDSFIEQRKKIEMQELMSAILFNDYNEYAAISDIIDAIVTGKGMNEVMIDEKGENIGLRAGHGIKYYTARNNQKCFLEMIANYGSIMKSKSNKDVIDKLRYIVGDEVVDMIDNCYRTKILGSTRYINVEENSYAI